MVNEPIDAILLAGDRGASRNFLDTSKLMLEVEGIPLLGYVLNALDAVDRVRSITIIGPADIITDYIERRTQPLVNQTPIQVLEQHENVFQNFWDAFTHTIEGYYPGIEKDNSSINDRFVLVVPSDTPLISAAEVNEFLDNSPIDALDFCVGMTEEQHLRKFYPTEEKPGIKMTYLHMREGSFRLNNLHLVRPLRIDNLAYIEKLYERRYQKQFSNIFKIAGDFIRNEDFGFKPIYIYAMLELAVFFEWMQWRRLKRFISNRITQSEVTRYSCILLKTRLGIVETTFGGCATDIDNAQDYATITARFQEWTSLVHDESANHSASK